MRSKLFAVIVPACLGVLALHVAPAAAQTPAEPAASTSSTFNGRIDFGARTTSLSGDSARYERYRDLGDGLFLDALRTQFVNNNGWYFTTGVDHLARRDARYDAAIARPGRFRAWGQFDRIPMLMSRTTSTLYSAASPGVLRINDVIQQTLQSTATAQRPAVMSNFLATQSTVFDTKSRRDIGSGGVEFLIDPSTTVRVKYQHTNREGVIPFGATFGFSNAVEVAAPVDHRTDAVNAFAERVQGPWLFQAGYDHTTFTNQVSTLIWDNPYQLTDATSAPSQGRMALAPDNTSYNVSGTASLKLPRRSRATVYVNMGVLDSNATILPNTINSALAVIPLDRTTTGGRAETLATNMTFTSRPHKNVGINARYRYFDFKNRTPEYRQTGRVGYDTSLSTLATPNITPRYGGVRQSFDGDLTLRAAGSTFGVGYGRKARTFEERIFESSAENTFRLLYDAFSSRWFSAHSKYEHSVRRGSGLDTAELVHAGEQPGLRTFDIADRDRDLFTMTGTVTPTASLGISLSAGAGKDAFPNSQFGLFNSKHGIYSAGFSAAPRSNVTFGASYDIETYRTLQWSRQANPGVQFNDPSRDWSTSGRDRVHSFLANVDVSGIAERLDIRANYDFNRGSTLYLYGTGSVLDRTLPEGSTVVPSTLPTPVSLPEVMSELTRGTVDATYVLTRRFSVGVSYWFERYKVEDFALDAEAIPQLNLPSSLLLGYQYLPYTAHTVWGRLIVHW
jgi:MtrB/PioB family decaheme-associated outer membrane protein